LLAIQASNEGLGPAFDVDIKLTDSPPDWGLDLIPLQAMPQPLSLAVDNSVSFRLIAAGSQDVDLFWAAFVKKPGTEETAEVILAGVIKACYRDLYGRELRSEARLESVETIDGLRMGPTSLRQHRAD
jgi:hypothetical protein